MTIVYSVIENEEDRVGVLVTRRRIMKTDYPQYPSEYRHALHYGYTDGRGTILRYDNENETIGRHERHSPDGIQLVDFPGMMALRDRSSKKSEPYHDR